MHVLDVVDVNEALPRALLYLYDKGQLENTRNGPAFVAPEPVTTVYRYPRQRVLFNPERDANPFFHLFESLWILAGQRDVKFLSWFNSRIAQYSDDGITFHAPYGYRLRKHFGFDQIAKACVELKQNSASRRVVLQIWDPKADLCTQSKDLPCNDTLMLRVRQDGGTLHRSGHVLDLTVCNRSNDAVWGAYGANAVQFSMLQEYMAAAIGVGVGFYRQVSNNLHVYTDNPFWQHWIEHGRSPFATDSGYYHPHYVEPVPLVNELRGETIDMFDADLARFFNLAVNSDTLLTFVSSVLSIFNGDGGATEWQTDYFRTVVQPMLVKYKYRGSSPMYFNPQEVDWHLAAEQWIGRRAAKAAGEYK